MSPEDPKIHLAREWLRKAQDDLAAADRAAQSPPLPDIAAYHCQQVAEKALKAYLTAQDQPFRRTHDLVALVGQCRGVDPGFASLVPACEILAPYAVDVRYPEGITVQSAEELAEAQRLARETLAFVLARLPPGFQA
jgi:HEPN domain-containing protein